MLCECGGTLNASQKCTVCGRDSAKADAQVNVSNEKPVRSIRMTFFLQIVIGVNLVYAASLATNALSGKLEGVPLALAIFGAFGCTIEAVLAMFMLGLRRWARNAYLGLSFFNIVIRLFVFDFITPIIRCLLMYFIFSKDWKKFR